MGLYVCCSLHTGCIPIAKGRALRRFSDMMLTIVFLRFIVEKFENGLKNLREKLIAQGLNPDDKEIFQAFFDDL